MVNKLLVLFVCFIFIIQMSGFSLADDKIAESTSPKDKTPRSTIINNERPISNVGDNKPLATNKESNKPHPNIAFEVPDFDFGKVYRGSKVDHIFKFKNQGTAELKIEKVRSSCGCTAAMLSSKTIKPNATGEVKVSFNSQSFSGDVKKNVTVYSDDPDTPKFKLSIFGVVIEEVSVNPKRIDFSKVPYKTEFSKKLSVTSTTDLKLEIEKVETSNSDVAVSFGKDETNNEYFVNATVKKDTDFGRINGKLIIYTNSKNQKQITVPFYGEVIGDFSVYPPTISCGIVTKKREMMFPVYAISYKEDIKVERVEINPELFETNITETKINSTKNKKNTYKISVVLKKDAPNGKIKESLKIYTNSKTQAIIEIPVKGEVRG